MLQTGAEIVGFNSLLACFSRCGLSISASGNYWQYAREQMESRTNEICGEAFQLSRDRRDSRQEVFIEGFIDIDPTPGQIGPAARFWVVRSTARVPPALF